MQPYITANPAKSRQARLAAGSVVNVSELIALDCWRARFSALLDRPPQLRFFGGLSVEETANVLEISPQSVMRDWRIAKAWLLSELQR